MLKFIIIKNYIPSIMFLSIIIFSLLVCVWETTRFDLGLKNLPDGYQIATDGKLYRVVYVNDFKTNFFSSEYGLLSKAVEHAIMLNKLDKEEKEQKEKIWRIMK